MVTQTTYFDAIIVGGGMIGSALALGLGQQGYRILVVEHQSLPSFSFDSPPDLRISALSYGSIKLLKRLNVWSSIVSERAQPYTLMETWETPTTKVSFSAEQLDIPYLGYMVENNLIQYHLWQQCLRYDSIEMKASSTVEDMQRLDNNDWSLKIKGDNCLYQAPLIIGADGINSLVRHFSGIGVTGWDYEQYCMLILVNMLDEPEQTTWQEFTSKGPRAFLPLFDHYAILVWYDNADCLKSISALPKSQFKAQIHSSFPAKLGDFEIESQAIFPIRRQHAQRYYEKGILLVGDAAHTINPLAGQGANLGYRDVEALLNILSPQQETLKNLADASLFGDYQRKRYRDNLAMQTAMDLFYFGFKNTHPAVKLLRNTGLYLAQRSGKLKDIILKYAIGL